MRRLAVLLLLLPALVSAATLRVPSEHPTIQSAIDLAASGDTVLVAPGTYADATTRVVNLGGGAGSSTVTAAVIFKDGVSVVSEGGSGVTTLDASAVAVVGAGWPVVGGGLPSSLTRLQGFRIVPPAGWNAVHFQFCGTIAIEDCVVEDATSGGGDAAGAISTLYCDVIMKSCVFARCSGILGGAVSLFAGSFVVEDSRFESCVAGVGGGLHLEGCITFAPGKTVRVSRCEFVGNAANTFGGGGLSFTDDGGIVSRTVEDCLFVDNEGTAAGGAAVVVSVIGPAILQRNTVIRCRASAGNGHGGGFVASGPGASLLTVQGNTFVDCYQGKTSTGGAALRAGSSAKHIVKENLFVGSLGAPAVHLGITIVENSCNVYWDNELGESNVPLDTTDRILDPLFCAPQVDDYRLSADSPCLDQNSASCGTVGALGEGCGPVSIRELSWGAVKGRYR